MPAFLCPCLAYLLCLSSASLGYSGISGNVDEVRGGSKAQWGHLCKREI